MQNSLSNDPTITRHSAGFVGFGLGFIISLPFLSGNEEGQVNILILLLLFVGLPLFGLVLSSVSLLKQESDTIQRIKATVLFLGDRRLRHFSEPINRLLLLYHGQYGAVGWALGSVSALMLLLVFTDINFVWRSTVLSPETLLPVLNLIAVPWFFWESAQPSMALLSATQDSRLTGHDGAATVFGQWWPFIIACQLFYSFLLRVVAMLALNFQIRFKLASQAQSRTATFKSQAAATSSLDPALVHEMPEQYNLVNWAGFPKDIIAQLEPMVATNKVYAAGPLATRADQEELIGQGIPQVILVKAWEAPLEELGDYLQGKTGRIFPIEIRAGIVASPQTRHLDEWIRFVSKTPGWLVYANKEAQ